MDWQNVGVIARKELRDALRNRWFGLFALAFTLLALGLTALSQPTGLYANLAGYSRTAASLINLVLLFVPLLGLTLGAANLASDQETGALAYLLAQPVTRIEILLGKYMGLVAALWATLCGGFGLAGAVLTLQARSADVGGYLLTVLLAALLALAMLGVGLLIATFAHKTAAALGGALFVWLLLVFMGDLGIMGTALVTKLPIQGVFFVTLLNPLQVFKLAAIAVLQGNLDVLGPAGVYATKQFGAALLPLLFSGLLLWAILPLGAAVWRFARQERFHSKSRSQS